MTWDGRPCLGSFASTRPGDGYHAGHLQNIRLRPGSDSLRINVRPWNRFKASSGSKKRMSRAGYFLTLSPSGAPLGLMNLPPTCDSLSEAAVLPGSRLGAPGPPQPKAAKKKTGTSTSKFIRIMTLFLKDENLR